MSARSSRGLRYLRPRDVPGYAEARAQGRTPQVPVLPPPLLPGLTAHQMFVRALLKCAIVFPLTLVVIDLIAEPGPSGDTLPWLGLPVMMAPFVLAWRWGVAVGRRNIEELQHGYTTHVQVFGQFHIGGGSHVRDTDAGPPWDYSGTWVLLRDGRVKSAPQPGYDPPGLYPSPARPGAYELWTGASWTGYYPT
ncbi:hypothetical protein CLV92_1228 [Kineococcus xinjiangensis]|uniref:Uncharacterized protein n=1 Tax=Kineococcus xinjiangensis TaxID=512762 RepID=A0A2S6IC77_9ACTN|nr:hypothetical protein [Kineococcus xinjiangensis]PPK90833.1 hypothetical protein CLV92_1228 [Kineococcus xinjiangensis]